MQFFGEPVDVVGFHILYLLHACVIEVGHADLLTLIHIRRAAQRHEQGAEQLGGLQPVLIRVPKARYASGLVVVFKIVGVPFQRLLPFRDRLSEATCVEAPPEPFDEIAVGLHMLEREYHIELAAALVAKVFAHLRRDENRLADGKTVVLA